ncbi:hypothetical protein [Pediococcus claussenii]|uniref:hypothetical protein n=1 Tax=Pediococcus claussenii TaxID=187452 RepID=UPI00081A625E|nr:hypothetical protein [Pediococcus claussenii]ANZ69399.1 hypothetical protein AYR57_03345 [Pediococcus claussenii]ANZ71219.1 hypothetical protein AYR58_03360 [Pediococcus claussenii]
MKIKSAVITMVLLAGIVLAGCRKQVTTSSNSSTSKTESSKENSSSSKKKETKIEKLSTSQIFNKYFANKTLVSKISETSIIDIEHTTDQGYTFVGKHRANVTGLMMKINLIIVLSLFVIRRLSLRAIKLERRQNHRLNF